MKKGRKFRQHQSYLYRWLKFGFYAGICENCHQQVILFFKYDAVCCPNCNIWIDDVCGDPNCSFCNNRPDTPIEALYIEEILEMERNSSDLKEYFIQKYDKRLKGKRKQNKKRKNIAYNLNKK